jgi:hypothetical protein
MASKDDKVVIYDEANVLTLYKSSEDPVALPEITNADEQIAKLAINSGYVAYCTKNSE